MNDILLDVVKKRVRSPSIKYHNTILKLDAVIPIDTTNKQQRSLSTSHHEMVTHLNTA